MLYLNNIEPIVMDEFLATVDYSFATGARVAVHAPYTFANMLHGVSVSPGVETTLAVKQIERKRLEEPWDSCTNRQYIFEDAEENGGGIRYTADSCLSFCAQDQVPKNVKHAVLFGDKDLLFHTLSFYRCNNCVIV